MKRLWIGVALLALLLAVGVYLTAAFEALHRPLADKMEAASAAAIAGDWEKAMALTDEARADWKRIRHFTAAVADHEPLEEMDSLFSRLEILGKLELRADFAAECRRLACLAEAIAESQAVTWWNLL